jgi:pseudomonalisin
MGEVGLGDIFLKAVYGRDDERQQMRESSRTVWVVGIFATICLFEQALPAQAPLDLDRVQPTDRITTPVDDRMRVTLSGNRHPLARSEYDIGAAAPDNRMERMMLVLRADADQQQALEGLLEAQQDAQSPLYHRWLTPESFGRTFGVSDHDLNQVVSWLEANGFAVEPVSEGRRVVIFSGTAAQVDTAFRTEMRVYLVKGELHHANATDPQIPRALAAVVGGVVSLHDFRAEPLHRRATPAADAVPEYTSGSAHYLAPADFAAIYDVGPLYGSSTNGTGQSIAVVGRTNIQLADVESFRSRMGLPANNPAIVLNGPNPGIVSQDEQMEAELDVEWSGAVAQNAAIQLVVSASTTTTDGVDLSAEYIVNQNLAPVVTLSFGSCEAGMGTAENQFWNALWQQAAAQGMSVFVASGDSGAAGCDRASAATAVSGRAVNGLCSSPYSTCVGGTEFSDTVNPALYWSPANYSSTLGSALTYIPEAAWNESGSVAGGSQLWSSGGGASMVYSKPSWQTGTGVPADGRRDVPDVALTAAGHDAYLVSLNGAFYAVSGTSAATPSFAGLAALVVERQGARQGNLNSALYTLASRQASGGAAVFHDITSGNNTVPGQTGYSAGAGYDLVTGLGSVDANQLVNAWGGGAIPISSFQLSASPAAVYLAQGSNAASTWTVSVSGGFRSAVTLSLGNLPNGLTAVFVPAGFASPGAGTSALTLTAAAKMALGTYNLVITASGGGISKTAPLAVTVASRCVYSLSPTAASEPATAASDSVALTATAGCPWTAASKVSWIAVTGAAAGNGNGKISYSLAANSASSARSGWLTIAGLTFPITQAGAPATTFALGSASASAAAAGGSGTVAILAPSKTSTWKAVSNAGWIVITGAASGTGTQNLTYTVAANSSTAARTGTMTIAGLTFRVNQAAAGCAYQITLGSISASASGYSDSVAVTAPTGCSWTALSNVSWVTVKSGASGNGNGTVTFAIAFNNTGKTETGTLTVAGHTLTITVGVTGSAEIGGPMQLP